jgi:hypothetical protein
VSASLHGMRVFRHYDSTTKHLNSASKQFKIFNLRSVRAMGKQWQTSLSNIAYCSQPVIICMHGACIGAGIEMAAVKCTCCALCCVHKSPELTGPSKFKQLRSLLSLQACDIRFCTADAFFAMPGTNTLAHETLLILVSPDRGRYRNRTIVTLPPVLPLLITSQTFLTEADIALAADVGGLQRFPKIVGLQHAFAHLFCSYVHTVCTVCTLCIPSLQATIRSCVS